MAEIRNCVEIEISKTAKTYMIEIKDEINKRIILTPKVKINIGV